MLTAAAWSPPYDRDTVSGFADPAAVIPAPGDLLLMRLEHSPENGARTMGIPAAVRELRRRHSGCPVVMWIPVAPPQVVVDAVLAAGEMQVRGILGTTQPDPALIRQQLTDPAGLSAFVLRWAADAGYLPCDSGPEGLRDFLDVPPDVRTLNRLARQRKVAARTWRRRLQQLGLPNPHAWFCLAHALHVAFYLQRYSSEPLHTLSERLGMQTPAELSRKLKRVFGVAPGEVRGLLGAEPLLHRWFEARVRR
jgi:AraC-like DNA-binding protein